MRPTNLDRRELLGLAGLSWVGVATGCAGSSSSETDSGESGDSDVADTDSAADTDVIVDTDCAVTTADIEGPFYEPDAPERADLDLYGDQGTPLVLTGRVTDAECNPIVGALVDLWQADPSGAYDNTSEQMRYRGQIETDGEGRYALTTLKPGWYKNGSQYRPAHIHVKIWVNGHERLTTQLYFEGDPYIPEDPWAADAPERWVALSERNDGTLEGTFDVAV